MMEVLIFIAIGVLTFYLFVAIYIWCLMMFDPDPPESLLMRLRIAFGWPWLAG